MDMLWDSIASIIANIAEYGAESPSLTILYEPEIPEELQQ